MKKLILAAMAVLMAGTVAIAQAQGLNGIQITNLIQATPAEMVRIDPDLRQAGLIRQTNLLIRDENQLATVIKAYADHRYYMGRLEVKIHAMAAMAGMSAEYSCLIETTRQNTMRMDSASTVVSPGSALAACSIRLNPKDRFVREAYNCYVIRQAELAAAGAAAQRAIQRYLLSRGGDQTSLRNRYTRIEAQAEMAKARGVADAGGVSHVQLVVAQFTNSFLVPVFEGANSTTAPVSAAEAAAKALNVLSTALAGAIR